MNKSIILLTGAIALVSACGIFRKSEPKVEELVVENEQVVIQSNDNNHSPNQADVDRVQGRFPGYTLEQLNDGKLKYEANCTYCHDLFDPLSQTEESWKGIVPGMVKGANRKNGNTLDAAGEESILRYVITMGPARLD